MNKPLTLTISHCMNDISNYCGLLRKEVLLVFRLAIKILYSFIEEGIDSYIYIRTWSLIYKIFCVETVQHVIQCVYERFRELKYAQKMCERLS